MSTGGPSAAPEPTGAGPGDPGDLGDLAWVPAAQRPELLAPPVLAGLLALPGAPDGGTAAGALVAAIDPSAADTAELVRRHGVAARASGNCVVVAGRRGDVERVAACVVPATTRADVNGVVRRALEARKASFLPQERAVAESGMEFGGITPLGLPADWAVFVDAALVALPHVVVGSGVRGSKLAVPGALLAALPGVRVVDGLGLAADGGSR